MENRKQPSCSNSEEAEIRKGPWTMEEDLILMNYIGAHGEGVWNSLAKAAGLKRTGKSCRLRWLNYLRPDVRRGNITQEEQILIMDLHAKWGNRWSKIAKHLPGRTDNEIKNFWRTRIQKLLKQGGIGGDGDGVRGGCSNAAEQQQQSSNSEHSTSQMSTAGSSRGAHHDPYSASSYRVPAPNMDTSFHLGSGSGSGSGSGYYVMHPPPPPHATMPLDPAEQYWPHAMDAEFWPMHLFNPDQGKPM